MHKSIGRNETIPICMAGFNETIQICMGADLSTVA